jgi:hypothetical protein
MYANRQSFGNYNSEISIIVGKTIKSADRKKIPFGFSIVGQQNAHSLNLSTLS